MPLEGILGSRERAPRGPAPTFEDAHLLLALLTIGESGYVGRGALAKKLDLGEGAVRTVLKRLRDEDYADANASGSYLTKAGNALFGSVRKSLTPFVIVTGSQLTIGKSHVAVALRGKGRSVRSGVEQRDAAIKVGASGATTYVIRAGKFSVPGGSLDCEKDFPNRAWATLRGDLKPRDGDAVILCGGDGETAARLGALAAAITLM